MEVVSNFVFNYREKIELFGKDMIADYTISVHYYAEELYGDPSKTEVSLRRFIVPDEVLDNENNYEHMEKIVNTYDMKGLSELLSGDLYQSVKSIPWAVSVICYILNNVLNYPPKNLNW